MILDHILHLNVTGCFGGKSLAFNSNNGLQILSKPLPFLSNYVPYTRMRITPENAVYPQLF